MGLPILIPWLMRARAVARVAKTFSRMSQAHAGTKSGDTSDVETRYLEMTLDHDSGEMTGIVRDGTFKGMELASLTTAQLVELLNVCRLEDIDSERVLEAFLDRNRPDWRDFDKDGDRPHGHTHKTTMDRTEAFLILGLTADASRDDIKAAHRKLISGMHPDHGGSDYLAAQINQAKDILLGDSQ